MARLLLPIPARSRQTRILSPSQKASLSLILRALSCPFLRGNLCCASHTGVNKTIALTRGLYFWPGMNNDIKQLVSTCRECLYLLQSQPSNPMTTSPPFSHLGYPMQHVGLDLSVSEAKHISFALTIGVAIHSFKHYALSRLHYKSARLWFNTLGWPSSICSDGGPPVLWRLPQVLL